MPAKTVEDIGCDVGCMTLDKNSGEVVVARRDAIYTYHADGRGPPKAYESLKKMITAHRDYIGLACPPASSTSKDPTAMRNRLGSGAGGIFNASTFVLLEPDLRIIGHTETLISPVKFVFEVWGDLFTVTEEGKVSHLQTVGELERFSHRTDISISRKGATAEVRNALPKKHVSSSAGACTPRRTR